MATDPDGLTARSNAFTITVIGSLTPPDDIRFVTINGRLVAETDQFTSTLTGGDHSWVPVFSPGATGLVTMQALPDQGTRRNSIANSPALNIRAFFAEAGEYFVWLRGLGVSNGNTAHVGLNGSLRANGVELPFDWGWSNTTFRNNTASIVVPSAGVHEINLWMREDGVVVDRILLTLDEDFEPSGGGPAQTLNQ